jgi:ectoine hydroxylase-related dioxygenase (phytanoyl-CoA dioxygenase family)
MTPHDLKYYNSYGFCIIRNVLTKKNIKKIQETIIDRTNLDFDINFKKNDFNKNFFHKYLLKKRKESPEKFSNFYSALQTNINIFSITSANKIRNNVKKILQIKKDFLNCSDFLLRADAPFDKRNSLDWHQDSTYFKRTADLKDCCVIWIPLQKIDNKIGPLNMIASSHLRGNLPYQRVQKNSLSSPQNKINSKFYKNQKVKKFNMSLGDVLFMDSKVIHRSGKNLSNKFRFTILSRMVSSFNKTFIPGRLVYQYQNEYNNNQLKRS